MPKVPESIIVFKPQETESEQILLNFIMGAKSLPFMPSSKIIWEDLRWDLSGLAKPERVKSVPTVNYGEPAGTPIGDFIRAYVAWEIARNFGSLRQIFKYTKPINSFKEVIKIMKDLNIENPCDLTPEILDESIANMADALGGKSDSWAQKAKSTQWITDVLKQYGMQNVPYEWSIHPWTKSNQKSRIESEDDDEKKQLTEFELDALTDAYHSAITPRQKIVTAVLALLCSAPMRISELLELPIDVDVYLDPGDGYQAGLRWFPKKGGMPSIKYVPKAMVPVVREALSRIRQLTDPARNVAIQMLEYESCYDTQTTDKFVHWPYIDQDKRVRVDKALFLVQHNLLNNHNVNEDLVALVTYSQIAIGIGERKSDMETIFHELGIRLPDGSQVSINTHKPRHYLNTIAQQCNTSQADIAKWYGRKSIQQNITYDHETPKQLMERIRKKTIKNSTKLPIIYKQDEFSLAAIKETAHTTLFGWCMQSLRQSPCTKFGSCLSCEALVCVKGANEKLSNIKNELERTLQLYAKAEEKIAAGLRVDARWIQQFETKIERLTQLVEILEDEKVEDGSFVMLSEDPTIIPYSPIQDAVAKHQNKVGKL